VLEEGCYFEGQSRRHSDPLKIAPLPFEDEPAPGEYV
jgi:hypothetical protein